MPKYVVPDPVRHIDDDERRARMARRQGLAPQHRYDDAEAATRAMTALHATEPPSPYLSLFARVHDVTLHEIDKLLYDDRALVKQLAMRRTMFVFPRDLLPAAWGSISARVAQQERRNVFKDALASGVSDDADAWFAAARAAVQTQLADGRALTAQQLREQVTELQAKFTMGEGRKWGGTFSFGPRILSALGAEALIVRGHNTGHWRLSRHEWNLTERWLGEPPAPLTAEEGYAELVRHWLWTFGPGTEADIVWWLGSTKGAVRQALADINAVPVSLDGGLSGWVLPDDVDPVPPVDPWAALLPVLDPTTMGWRNREFYLDPAHTPYLFDTAGNAGTTAWWNGRIVGCWVHEEDGTVKVLLRESIGAEERAAFAVEAERLTAWLDGVKVSTIYNTQMMKGARLP